MTKRFLTFLAAGALAGSIGATGALAESLPHQNECDAYQRDLKQDLLLIHSHAPIDADVLMAIEAAEQLQSQGDGAQCVAILQAAITSLGLPLRSYSS